MRIFCCVCYFLTLFYGVELVVEDTQVETTPPNIVMTYDNMKPLKESTENSNVCVYYSTYKMCTDLYSKQVTYFSIEDE
ncbi:hypothetical protein AEA09_08265 [Lysinibacillus contaminans]|uniref:Transcriptional regulator n=1 Tax=Lysinibacillus contaminans TaxID=1293441 RepID=A0ABR5K1E1_9BACI|nr:hypothetical protein AEA09_08265 [Lysinibacillus contaminans]